MTRLQRIAAVLGGTLALGLAAFVVHAVIEPTDPVNAIRRLAESGRLNGVSEAEIHARYGQPVITAYFADWDDRFIIGNDGSYFAIDNSWLVVRYDAERRVREARVVVD